MTAAVQYGCKRLVDKSFIFYLYLPAQGSREDLGTSLDELSEVISSIEEGAHTIVCGDFNGDIGTQGGTRGFKTPGSRGRLVPIFFRRHDLLATNLQHYARGPVNTFASQKL